MAKSYSAAELTRMQDLGSAWVFRRVLNDNQRYNSQITTSFIQGRYRKIYPLYEV